MKMKALKKLGLGASAMACLVTTGMPVSASEITGDLTTGGSTNGSTPVTYSYGKVGYLISIPTSISFSGYGEDNSATGTIKVVLENGSTISDVYDRLTIDTTITSSNSFNLLGDSSQATLAYSGETVGAGASSSWNSTDNSKFRIGYSYSAKSIDDTVELRFCIDDIPSEEDTYKDTLNFTFKTVATDLKGTLTGESN